MSSTLQLEFQSRQECNRFKKTLIKDKLLATFFDGKADRCIWLKFENDFVKQQAAQTFLRIVKNISIEKRESGVEYLLIKNKS